MSQQLKGLYSITFKNRKTTAADLFHCMMTQLISKESFNSKWSKIIIILQNRTWVPKKKIWFTLWYNVNLKTDLSNRTHPIFSFSPWEIMPTEMKWPAQTHKLVDVTTHRHSDIQISGLSFFSSVLLSCYKICKHLHRISRNEHWETKNSRQDSGISVGPRLKKCFASNWNSELFSEREARCNKGGNLSERAHLQPQTPTQIIIKTRRRFLLAYDRNHI